MITWTPLRPLVLSALLALLLAHPAFAQQTPAQAQASQPQPFPVVAADEVGLAHFRPQHSDPHELHRLARELLGRRILVDQGGDAPGSRNPVDTIQLLGDTLLVFDDEQRVGAVLARLKTLDQAAEHAVEGRAALETLHWRPRHAALRDVDQALQPFKRSVPVPNEFGGVQQVHNVTTTQGGSLLVVRDTPANLEAIRAVLAEVDRPTPQVMISALVIEGGAPPGEGGDDARVPALLRQHLAELLPYEHFQLRSMGLVRSSVRAESVDLVMPGEGKQAYQLRLRPLAYDAQAGVLSVDAAFESRDDRDFQTRAQIPTGEFTVLGATGERPLFLVLRLAPLEAGTSAASDAESTR